MKNTMPEVDYLIDGQLQDLKETFENAKTIEEQDLILQEAEYLTSQIKPGRK